LNETNLCPLFDRVVCAGSGRLRRGRTARFRASLNARSAASEQSETVPQSEVSRTWTEEEVLELYESGREENWEQVDCVTFYDQSSDLVGAVLFQNSDTQTAGVAFLGADGSCRMGGTDAPLADDPGFEYLGDGAVTFKVKGEDGKTRSHTMSITIEGVNVTFKSVDK